MKIYKVKIVLFTLITTLLSSCSISKNLNEGEKILKKNNLFINEILNSFLQKKTSLKIRILLLCAITQIIYLDFKDYAVTNDTVEVAKIKKLNPGLVNSLLKNIIKNKEQINKKKFNSKEMVSYLKGISKKYPIFSIEANFK